MAATVSETEKLKIALTTLAVEEQRVSSLQSTTAALLGKLVDAEKITAAIQKELDAATHKCHLLQADQEKQIGEHTAAKTELESRIARLEAQMQTEQNSGATDRHRAPEEDKAKKLQNALDGERAVHRAVQEELQIVRKESDTRKKAIGEHTAAKAELESEITRCQVELEKRKREVSWLHASLQEKSKLVVQRYVRVMSLICESCFLYMRHVSCITQASKKKTLNSSYKGMITFVRLF